MGAPLGLVEAGRLQRDRHLREPPVRVGLEDHVDVVGAAVEPLHRHGHDGLQVGVAGRTGVLRDGDGQVGVPHNLVVLYLPPSDRPRALHRLSGLAGLQQGEVDLVLARLASGIRQRVAVRVQGRDRHVGVARRVHVGVHRLLRVPGDPRGLGCQVLRAVAVLEGLAALARAALVQLSGAGSLAHDRIVPAGYATLKSHAARPIKSSKCRARSWTTMLVRVRYRSSKNATIRIDKPKILTQVRPGGRIVR